MTNVLGDRVELSLVFLRDHPCLSIALHPISPYFVFCLKKYLSVSNHKRLACFLETFLDLSSSLVGMVMG